MMERLQYFPLGFQRPNPALHLRPTAGSGFVTNSHLSGRCR